eukprot:759928-Hanusia_phi.AAC.9
MGPRLPVSLQQLPQHVLSHLVDLTRHQAHPAGLPVGVVAVVDEFEQTSSDLRLVPVDLLLVALLSQLHLRMCHLLSLPGELAQLLEERLFEIQLLLLPPSLDDDYAGLQEARGAHVDERGVLALPVLVLADHVLRAEEEESVRRLDRELDVSPLRPCHHSLRHLPAHLQFTTCSFSVLEAGTRVLSLPVVYVDRQVHLHNPAFTVAPQVSDKSSCSSAPSQLSQELVDTAGDMESEGRPPLEERAHCRWSLCRFPDPAESSLQVYWRRHVCNVLQLPQSFLITSNRLQKS